MPEETMASRPVENYYTTQSRSIPSNIKMMPEETITSQAVEDFYTTQDCESESSESEFFDEPLSNEDENETSEIELLKLTRSKALLEFRSKIEESIQGNSFLSLSKKGETNEEITLWGVPLLPSKGHPGTDIVLMKFLSAKKYKVREAFRMLRKTVKWRKEYQVDTILDEKFSPELQSMWCINGVDKEGRPICYHSFRDFKNYRGGSGSGSGSGSGWESVGKKFWKADNNLKEILRWRIQCVEKEIKMLDFNPGGINSIIHIIDMKNTPRPAIQEIRWFFRKMVTMIYENYPGVIHKSFIVNVPLWFFALNAINLREMIQRSTRKAVFLRSPKVTKTLLKCITPENLLSRYGGLKRENDTEFSTDDKVLEFNIRANVVEYIQIPVNEAEMTITWDVTVVGSDVTYKEEFVPNDDGSYRVLLQKESKIRTNSIRNSFYIREPGHILITIGNPTFKKRKLFYRTKTKPCFPLYTIRN